LLVLYRPSPNNTNSIPRLHYLKLENLLVRLTRGFIVRVSTLDIFITVTVPHTRTFGIFIGYIMYYIWTVFMTVKQMSKHEQ